MTDVTMPPTGNAIDYLALFRQMPERALLLNIDDPDFTVVEMTDAHSAMTGLSRDKVLLKPLFASFPDVSEKYRKTGVSDLLESFREVIRTKKPNTQPAFRYDIRSQGAKGFTERYWRNANYPIFDAKHRLRYILQVPTDATAEVLAERQLEQVKVSLDEALEIGKVGRWVWNLQENLIIADRNLAKIFNLPEREAMDGLPVETFLAGIHAADRVRVRRAIEKVRAENAYFDEEYRTHTPDGSIRWAIARGKVIHQDGKRIFSGVIVDITERRDMQLQIELAHKQDELNRREAQILQRRNDELETLSRTKDEFVALASHQLRTPATAVKQYLGMVLQGYAGSISDTQTYMLDKAFESNERQIQIINQILNAARADTGRLMMTPAPVDVRALTQGITDEMRKSIEQLGHRFSVRTGQQALVVQADASYLRMAIENLLHNAAIYTPAGGQVSVELKKEKHQLHLSVTDTGVGIKKSDMVKLFKKFSRIHNRLSVQAGGSGIGLYLAEEIVRLHGGKITVQSKINHGTTFAIYLPLAQNKVTPKGNVVAARGQQ